MDCIKYQTTCCEIKFPCQFVVSLWFGKQKIDSRNLFNVVYLYEQVFCQYPLWCQNLGKKCFLFIYRGGRHISAVVLLCLINDILYTRIFARSVKLYGHGIDSFFLFHLPFLIGDFYQTFFEMYSCILKRWESRGIKPMRFKIKIPVKIQRNSFCS